MLDKSGRTVSSQSIPPIGNDQNANGESPVPLSSVTGPVGGFTRKAAINSLNSVITTEDKSHSKISSVKSSSFKSLLRTIANDGSLPAIIGMKLTVLMALGFSSSSFAVAGVVGGFVAYTELQNLKFGDPIKNWIADIKKGLSDNNQFSTVLLAKNGLKWLRLNDYALKDWPFRAVFGSASAAIGLSAELIKGTLATAAAGSQLFSKPLRFVIESVCTLASMTPEERKAE